jgi:hypothetical protein
MDRFDPYVVEQLARQTRNADLQAVAGAYLVRQALMDEAAAEAPRRRPLRDLARGLRKICGRCAAVGIRRGIAPHA